MKNLVAIPVFALALMLQTAILSRTTLLSGAADLVLLVLVSWALQRQVESAWHWAAAAGLMFGFVSGLPPIAPIIGYLLVVALSRVVIRQIWQSPLLALLSVTFFGTLIYQLVTYAILGFNGTPLPFGDVLALIVLPSVFLNLLLSIPIHSVVRDLALWVYPVEEMV
jgi:rod shape-determining protein MreD